MRLSVIIPCYNAERFIGEAISSALAQSRPADEIIVVDDGSTDRSVAQTGRFAGRIQLVRQANAGAAAARNTGLAAARHDLIAFLDADDLWPPDSLACRMVQFDPQECDIVFGAVREFVDHGDGEPRLGTPIEGRLAGSMIIRRHVFDRVGNFDESLRSAEVVDLAGRARAAGFVDRATAEVVLHRRVHGANLMLRHSGASADVLRVLRRSIERKRGRAIA
jgi:glycosyltransferase involved in cell wall biosynthesis